jgi:hypothetical protein
MDDDRIQMLMDKGRVRHAQKVSDFFDKQEKMKLLFLTQYPLNINPEKYSQKHLQNNC